jgi:hypothetical protein
MYLPQVSQALALCRTARRVILTGTPLQVHTVNE